MILAGGKYKIKSVTVNGVSCSVSEASPLEKTFLQGDVAKHSVSLPLVQAKNSFVVEAPLSDN